MDNSPDPRVQQAATQPQGNPFGTQSVPLGGILRRYAAFLFGIIFLLSMTVNNRAVKAAWDGFTQFIGLKGKPAPASAGVLSEHETEDLDRMTPQHQAELLLERSVNHYQGANEQIETRVEGWRGKIRANQRFNSLLMTALNSDDLRVRAAAVEIDLAVRNIEKSAASIDRLEPAARTGEQIYRINALWDIGLLGSRGVQPERAEEILLASVHDDNEIIRFWAIEGLSYVPTDQTIAVLLQTFHDDPSMKVRERAACGLAQSGMLSAEQRRSTIPKLLDYAEDPALDSQTKSWVFHALRDITGQNLPHDATAWRNWYYSGQNSQTSTH